MKANKRWGMLWQKLEDETAAFSEERKRLDALGKTDEAERTFAMSSAFFLVKNWMHEMEKATT